MAQMNLINFMQVLALAGLLTNWVLGAHRVASLRARIAPQGAAPSLYAAWFAWPFFVGELRENPGRDAPEVLQIERTLNLVVLFAVLPAMLGLVSQLLLGN